MWKLKFNLKAYLSTAALPGQTTKTALTEEFMFQNVAYRPTVYITGENLKEKKSKFSLVLNPLQCTDLSKTGQVLQTTYIA